MLLRIKTLSQQTLTIEADEMESVFDVKKKLSLLPEVGVQPELLKLIYTGRMMDNDSKLIDYHILPDKFLVLMILRSAMNMPTTSKAAIKEATQPVKPEIVVKQASQKMTTVQQEIAAAMQPERVSTRNVGVNEEMVRNIIDMGYVESEVRAALAASFNNPERAIEYLIEGLPIPQTPTTSPALSTPLPSIEGPPLVMPPNALMALDDAPNDDALFDAIRSDPIIRNLRVLIRQHPELINDAVRRIGEANPPLLALINQNPDGFINMLLQNIEEENWDDDNSL